MKKHIIILLAVTSSLFLACESDSFEPDNFEDTGWYTSYTDDIMEINTSEVGGMESFADLSQNPLSHIWRVDKGIFFLKGSISRNDAEVDTILERFIVERVDTTSTDEIINVFFSNTSKIEEIDGVERRLKSIILRNTFRDSVTFRGKENVGSVWVDSLSTWVLEKEFLIDVYDSIVARVEVELNGERIWDNYLGNEYDSLIEITIEEEDAIVLKDRTLYDRPERINAFIHIAQDTVLFDQRNGAAFHPEDNTDAKLDVVFTLADEYFLSYAVNRGNANVPSHTDSIALPILVKVNPSTKPINVQDGNVVEIADFDTDAGVSTIFIDTKVVLGDVTGSESAFTITRESNPPVNPTKVYTTTNEIGVETIIALELDQNFDWDDFVRVEYDGTGGIQNNTGLRTMEAWGPLVVQIFDDNLLAQAGIDWDFTEGGQGWETTPSLGNGNKGNTSITFENGVMVVTTFGSGTTNAKWNTLNEAGQFPMVIPPGTYNMDLRYRIVQIDPGVTPRELRTRIREGTVETQVDGKFNFTAGDWQDLNITDIIFDPGTAAGGLQFQLKIGEQPTEPAIYWIDDIRLYPVP